MDRFGCMGGNITAVGVECFACYRHEQTVKAGGIGMEFETRAKEQGNGRSSAREPAAEIHTAPGD